MQRDRNYWKFPLFSGKAVAEEEPSGEINKAAWLTSNMLRRTQSFACNLFKEGLSDSCCVFR